jgi:hypothetical protein
MPLLLSFNFSCVNYRGINGDEEAPRSAHFAEFDAGPAPRAQLVIHRTRPDEYSENHSYRGKIEPAPQPFNLPEFPELLFQCSHINHDDTGEHAHLVAETGLNKRQSTLNLWNVAVGTFKRGDYYRLTIETNEIRTSPPQDGVMVVDAIAGQT